MAMDAHKLFQGHVPHRNVLYSDQWWTRNLGARGKNFEWGTL